MLVRRLAEPKSQSLFAELMMTKMLRQAQNSRHVTTAYFGGRLAHFAIELGVLLDNEDARFQAFAFEHKSSRRSRKRPADDHDIVIEIHGQQREWTLPAANAIVFQLDDPY